TVGVCVSATAVADPGLVCGLKLAGRVFIRGLPHLDFYRRPLALERSVDGFHHPHDLTAVPAAGERTGAVRNAIQEMAALVLERLCDFNSRADDVAVTHHQPLMAIIRSFLDIRENVLS